MDVPSKSQAKKAGSNLRKYFRGELTDEAVYHEALDTMESWRRAHYKPLVSANNGLRARARALGIDAEVTQRLKRSQTILDKLKREPTLDLSRMQDIGGCRAVGGPNPQAAGAGDAHGLHQASSRVGLPRRAHRGGLPRSSD